MKRASLGVSFVLVEVVHCHPAPGSSIDWIDYKTVGSKAKGSRSWADGCASIEISTVWTYVRIYTHALSKISSLGLIEKK